MEIVIEHTWDGQTVAARHRTTVAFHQATPRLIEISIDAPFFDDLKPEQAIGRCPRLWDYEVVELFLVDQHGTYVELEFGPHGHYLVLLLSGPRVVVDDTLVIDYSAKINGAHWQGCATLVLPTSLENPSPSTHSRSLVWAPNVDFSLITHYLAPNPTSISLRDSRDPKARDKLDE